MKSTDSLQKYKNMLEGHCTLGEGSNSSAVVAVMEERSVDNSYKSTTSGAV